MQTIGGLMVILIQSWTLPRNLFVLFVAVGFVAVRFVAVRIVAVLFGPVLFVAVRFVARNNVILSLALLLNCVSAGVNPRLKREPKFNTKYYIFQSVIHVAKEDTIFVAKSVAFRNLKIHKLYGKLG